MPKLTLPTVQSGYYTSTALNAIFDQIELEFDKVFYRNNPVSTPNSLSNDMDLNGNDVLNGGSAFFDKIVLQGTDFTDVVANSVTTISNYLTQAEAARDAAQASEIAAASSASSSSSSASAAASSASAASTSTSNASTSASLAAASEAQALASANSAATSESGAAGHAAAALASQIAAATSETNAAASEAVVLASEANVISLEASVQALSAQFRGTYYGEAPSDPTLDPLGNPPTAGDLYFNTTTSTLRLFDGVAWNLASVDPSTLGSASTYNVGVAANQIPTNADLPNFGDVVTYDTGPAAGQVPRNQDLGSASQADIATLAQALAGDVGVLITAEQARALIGQDVPYATPTEAGKIELATEAEAIAGTDTLRAVTPAGLAAAVTVPGAGGQWTTIWSGAATSATLGALESGWYRVQYKEASDFGISNTPALIYYDALPSAVHLLKQRVFCLATSNGVLYLNLESFNSSVSMGTVFTVFPGKSAQTFNIQSISKWG